MLESLRRLVPFDAAWVASTDRGTYRSLASTGLASSVVGYLGGAQMAHDIAVTGTDRRRPPLGPSDLPYPVEELPTWADCLIPAGIHEGLGVGLFEPGGRHVGFLSLLSADRRPPTSAARRRLGNVAALFAQAIDPMRSLTAASRFIGDAFAGVLLLAEGRTSPLPGLPADDLLVMGSALLETLRARLIPGEVHTSFLWPRGSHASAPGHVRVTYLAPAESRFSRLQGIVLLSPPGDVHRLTPRELEVLGMMVDGYSNQQIARRLIVTVRTAAAHIEHILAKLASPTRTHAAVHAQREGVYVPPAERPGRGDPHPPVRTVGG
jgi:DNA-binding CsgD family transcriptional regulator